MYFSVSDTIPICILVTVGNRSETCSYWCAAVFVFNKIFCQHLRPDELVKRALAINRIIMDVVYFLQ